jgi:PTS system N-acetylgalactosamine-specific IIA component
MSDRDVAIVVGHSDFAAGLISAVERITGRGDLFVPMSNEGLGAEHIDERLDQLVVEHGARVIFTDLAAGSCSIAACRLARQHDGLVVVTGVNLPALLHYATHTELSAREAAAGAADRARHSVKLLPG